MMFGETSLGEIFTMSAYHLSCLVMMVRNCVKYCKERLEKTRHTLKFLKSVSMFSLALCGLCYTFLDLQ